MKRTDIFLRCLNLVALSGYLLNVLGLLTIWYDDLSKVRGVFHLFLVVFLLTLEIQDPVPNMKYISFMKYPFGRGLFYIWTALSLLDDNVLSIIGTSITGAVGCLYLAAAFFNACCYCSKPRKAAATNGPETTCIDYAIDIEETEESSPAESSRAPLLPTYTKTDPNKC